MKEKQKVFSSWSGGKDSSLACYKAMEDGFEVTPLLNLLSEDGKRERSHGTRPFLLLEFIDVGFEAIVVATRIKREWLGRKFDRTFIAELKEFEFHPSGESGEYHTFVTDGPIFKRRIKVSDLEKVYVDGTWFLDIKAGELE
ncbi:Diphthamide synthase [Methanophagales archaeon]|nr:Diphthamide synthase [Methanophagales archaeon]